jgi:hypothetical protein
MNRKKNNYNHFEDLKTNKDIFLNYMKEKYPIFYNSNIFFRDVQYAIESYFELKELPVTYKKAEDLAEQFIGMLEENNELVNVDNNAWKVNFKFENPEKQAVAEEKPQEISE